MGCCDAALEQGTFAPADPGRVVRCLIVICGLGLPMDTGWPRVAEARSTQRFRFSSESISKATKLVREDDWKVGEPIEPID
jgi:hypothetical protein